MSDPAFTIRIGSTADTRGFDQATSKLHESEKAAHEFIDTLKLGVGIDLGGKLVESIREIPALLKEATMRGIEFNSLIESSTIAIAGALRSVDQSMSFEEAKRKGSDAIDTLKQKSIDLGLSFEDVVESFKINVPTMWQAGIHDTQQMIDMMILLNSVAAQKGISGFQAQRDITDLLNGRGERTMLGLELQANGVTTQAIKEAEANGTLMKLMVTHLGSYLQAMQAAANTWAGVMNTFHLVLDNQLANLTKPVYDELKSSLKELSDVISSPEGKAGLESLGIEIRDVVHDGLELTKWAIQNADTLVALGHAAGVVGLAFSAMKVAQLVEGLIGMGLRLTANTGLWEAETAAITANTAAKAANAEASGVAGAAGLAGAAEGAAAEGVALGGAGLLSRVVTGVEGIAVLAGRLIPILTAIVGAYDAFKYLPSSIAYGKLTSENDIAQAQQIGKDSKIPEYSEAVNRISSVADQNKLLSAIDDYRDSMVAASGYLDGDQEATRDAMKQEIALADALEKRIQGISLADMHTREAAAREKQIAATLDRQIKEKEDLESKWADENKKTKAARDEELKARKANADDQAAIDLSTAAAQRGEYSPYISQRQQALRTIAAANPRRDSGDPKVVEASNKLNDDIETQLQRLEEAKKKNAEEIRRYNIDSLKAQEQLVEAQGRKRLAELAARNESELDAANERKALEDDTARQKLEIQNRIADLESETDLDKKIRLTEYETEQIESATRVAAAQKNAAADAAAKINALPLNTDFLRTAYEAPLHHGGVDVPTQRISWIDQWRSQAAVPVGGYRQIAPLPMPARNPASAVASLAGSAPSGQGASASSTSSQLPTSSSQSTTPDLARTIDSNAAREVAALRSVSDSIARMATAVVTAIQHLDKQIALAQARIERANRA